MSPGPDLGGVAPPFAMGENKPEFDSPQASECRARGQVCSDFMVDLRSPSRLCQCGSPKSAHDAQSNTARRKLSRGSLGRGSVHQLAQAFSGGQAAAQGAPCTAESRWSAFGLDEVESAGNLLAKFGPGEEQKPGNSPVAQQQSDLRVQLARKLIGSKTVKAEREVFEAGGQARKQSRGPSARRGARDGWSPAAAATESATSDGSQSTASAARSPPCDAGEESDAEALVGSVPVDVEELGTSNVEQDVEAAAAGAVPGPLEEPGTEAEVESEPAVQEEVAEEPGSGAEAESEPAVQEEAAEAAGAADAGPGELCTEAAEAEPMAASPGGADTCTEAAAGATEVPVDGKFVRRPSQALAAGKTAFLKARETWTQAAREAEAKCQEERAAAAARAAAARQRREELAAAARMKEEAEAAASRAAEERALEEELAKKQEQDREQQRAAARERIEQREAARLRKARQREEEVRLQAELKEKAELEKAAATAATRTMSVECACGGLLMVAPRELQTLERYVPEYAEKTAPELAELLPKLHMGAWLQGSGHLFKK